MKMKYLIKDLSNITGLSPARIRKWQERYHILNPKKKGKNGYYYYDNEDLKILLFFKNEIKKGKTPKEILQIPRKDILSKEIYFNEFNSKEMQFIQYISEYNFKEIKNYLDKIYKTKHFLKWLQEIHNLIILTGKAWEKNFITISEEHTFSRWIYNYISSKIVKLYLYKEPIWLVAVFPGDPHELGALLHFAKLQYYKIPAKFVGMLPEKELLNEIKQNNYKIVSISIVIPQKEEALEKLKNKIQKISNTDILFGGYGYRLMLQQN
ncbi:MAG: helix-turn-helix domain-containing protein [Leptospiraceae bacterium]|nr:helix-turn-helix domain-containing protein [Leptospiraceae bacterium]